MADNKSKDGMSIKEIEEFSKKHRFEVFFCLAFVLACLFTFAMWGPGWSIIASAIGAVLGILFFGKVEYFSKKGFQFIFKHESGTQLVIAIVLLVLTIFVPPLYFLILGLHGGKSLRHLSIEMYNQKQR